MQQMEFVAEGVGPGVIQFLAHNGRKTIFYALRWNEVQEVVTVEPSGFVPANDCMAHRERVERRNVLRHDLAAELEGGAQQGHAMPHGPLRLLRS